jgi:hypothetical protein
MMKGLIMHKPKDPLQFLVKRLTSPESKQWTYIKSIYCYFFIV